MGGFMQAAFEQAQMGMDEGGIPVGSVIVKDGQVLGVGRNRFSQTGDPTTHAEMEAIRDAASRASEAELATLLEGAICCTTMMPCEMCSGAIMRFGITRVVVGENQPYIDAGTQPLLESQGIAVEVPAGSGLHRSRRGIFQRSS